MAKQLTREEEERLVAEAEAAYESGGYDLSTLQEVNLTVSDDAIARLPLAFTATEMRYLVAAAHERGMTLEDMLYAAVRSYTGLPRQEPAANKSKRRSTPDREHARP